ncbi:MAG: glycosyltransferase family 1 protein [Bacteroidales bacterium]
MKIAINARLLLAGKLDGIGWFSYEILKRISLAHPEHEFLFLFDRKPHPSFIFGPNVKAVVVFPPARHPFLWYLFFERGIPPILKKHKVDLFISTDGWMPLNLKIPSINVIHDLNFLHHPEFIAQPIVRLYYAYFFPKFAQQATRLVTVSNFTKEDIVHNYGIDPEKIEVVYNAAQSIYRPLSKEQQTRIQEKYSMACPYFIFVGTIHQRKNLANIFRAFDLFKAETKTEVKLLIAGGKIWWKGEIENTYEGMQNKKEVIFLGRVDADILSALMASSIALLYPSFFEGFGIPIVEAFHAEVPVLTSNITSMPEVAGEAAYYVEPYSVESIKNGMIKLYEDKNYCKELIALGRERKKMFSWDESAKKFWSIVEKQLHSMV